MTVKIYKVNIDGERSKSYKCVNYVESITDCGDAIEIRDYFESWRIDKEDHDIEVFI